MGTTMVNGEFGDEGFMSLFYDKDAPNDLMAQLMGKGENDMKHPTQEGRSFYKDLEDLIYRRTKAAMDENKIGREKRQEVAKAFKDLKREYEEGY
mmetsp:Transcript_24320/g.37604  ORF Transcript_24320/g.37604 Transcript_24320/m.37604 type:complete len:95 (+) Transcript_24320:3169-3453(+)